MRTWFFDHGTLLAVAIFAWGVVTLYAHAEPQPALDRQLVERLVRAEESQARSQERCTCR
jgi:hypothetical protein